MIETFFNLCEHHTLLPTFLKLDSRGAFKLSMLPVIMPLAVSITDGIAFGFISYAVLKLVTGRAREAHWLVHACAVLFVLKYVLLARS